MIIGGILGVIGKFTGKGNTIVLFGNSLYVVATPSMARVNPDYAEFLEGHNDQIQVGDLIVTRRIKKGEQLKVYDTVTFIRKGQTIVHRIVSVEVGADGEIWYETRGDSNNVSDGKRTIDTLTGVVVQNAGHGWGEVVKFMQSAYGIAAVAGGIAIILISILINDSISKKESEKKSNGGGQSTKKRKKLSESEKEAAKIEELFGDWQYGNESEDDAEDEDDEDDISKYDY